MSLPFIMVPIERQERKVYGKQHRSIRSPNTYSMNWIGMMNMNWIFANYIIVIRINDNNSTVNDNGRNTLDILELCTVLVPLNVNPSE